MRAAARRLVPRLPRTVWILQAGFAANTFGGGMVAPFVLIYLHSVRGFPLETAGLVVGSHFAVAAAVGIASGALVDRLGGRITGAVSLALLAGSFAAFPFLAERPWQAFALMAAAGVGRGGYWPAYSALLAGLTAPAVRHQAYAVQRVAGNLALGLGGLAGGLLASTAEPGTFTVLFLISAGASLAFVPSFALVPEPADVPRDASLRRGGYRRVLRDRYYLGVIGVNAVFVTAGVALLTTVLPVFAKTEVGLSEDVIGAIFFANTVTIVLAQLPLSQVVEGRRRMPVLTLTGALWAACWVAVLAASEGPAVAAALAFVAVGIAFGLGECLDGVIQGPLVADLAPAELRGRYMALWLITAQGGFAAGPALGGVLLAVSPAALWLPAAACCAVAGLAALALERGLPVEARRTPATRPSARVPAA